jgi:hypothetical protein
MCFYKDIQQKLIEEINNEIGIIIIIIIVIQFDIIFLNSLGLNIPQIKDRENCHFTNAFIFEILRLRNILPFGLPHTNSSNTIIGIK